MNYTKKTTISVFCDTCQPGDADQPPFEGELTDNANGTWLNLTCPECKHKIIVTIDDDQEY